MARLEEDKESESEHDIEDEEDEDEEESDVEEAAEQEDEEQSDEEVEGEEDREGDDVYQLTREEGPVISALSWKKTFLAAEYSEDLRSQIVKLKPYEKCPKTGTLKSTKSFDEFAMGICLYFDSGKKIAPKVMKSLCKDIFSHCDVLFVLLHSITKCIYDHKFTSKMVWQNLFLFLKSIPNPDKQIVPLFFKQKYHLLRGQRKTKIINIYQKLWIGILKCDVPDSVLVNMIPHITENVLDILKEPHKTSDFFFKIFEKGDVFSILSLGAIFKLIVHHNFDYPRFYDKVYSLTKSFVLHMAHKQKFVSLLDTFLSSTHIPSYIVAGFMKRLCRMLLLAPLDAQEPVLGLIRNLITRHPTLVPLMHREVPATLAADPYDENEPELSKCGAMESSLWEIKTLQKHWHNSVTKRANFVNKGLQKMESYVRFRCYEEYFSVMMSKRFGKDEESAEQQFERNQDGSDDDEDDDEPAAKRSKVALGKFQKKRKIESEHSVPINFVPPGTNVFPSNSLNFEYDKFWKV